MLRSVHLTWFMGLNLTNMENGRSRDSDFASCCYILSLGPYTSIISSMIGPCSVTLCICIILVERTIKFHTHILSTWIYVFKSDLATVENICSESLERFALSKKFACCFFTHKRHFFCGVHHELRVKGIRTEEMFRQSACERTSVRIAGNPTQIRTRYSPNTRVRRYRYSSLISRLGWGKCMQ